MQDGTELSRFAANWRLLKAVASFTMADKKMLGITLFIWTVISVVLVVVVGGIFFALLFLTLLLPLEENIAVWLNRIGGVLLVFITVVIGALGVAPFPKRPLLIRSSRV